MEKGGFDEALYLGSEVGYMECFAWRSGFRGGLHGRGLVRIFMGTSQMSGWRIVLLTIDLLWLH